MGYVEGIMGDHERVLYQTHQHLIVLVGRVLGWLFAFLVFLGVGLAVFFVKEDRVRFYVGVVALGSLVLPLYLIVSSWLRGQRGQALLRRLWRPSLAGILILAVAITMMFWPQIRLTGWLAVLLALFPLWEIVRAFLDWLNERYLITNRRVMEVKGVINKEISDSALEKVNDVKMRQSIVGRFLRYGTVEIITGSDIGVNMFRRISNPVRFKRAMLNAKEQLHTADLGEEPKGFVPSGRPAASEETVEPEGAVPAAGHIPDLIEELAELHRKGIISDVEFQEKKRELLARL
jgi:uncharacterized membrane protein YdbT with pleckstrin-like domain